MLEKWKSDVDNKKNIWDITNRFAPKVFDCLSHELLLAKLHAYGFRIPALVIVYSYLKTEMKELKFWVPQGSILGYLLFKIILCDLFYTVNDTDFVGYADDSICFS